MCENCRCPEFCDCNTSCCFGVRIPITLGYVFCNFWLLFNGFTLPLMSLIFWPKYYIFYSCCFLCALNSLICLISFENMRSKNHRLFNTVLYGILSIYFAAGLLITIAVNVEIRSSKELLAESFRKYFGVSVWGVTFVILQGTQIMYYTYLFVSYVYCGFILQLYEIKNDKRYTRSFISEEDEV